MDGLVQLFDEDDSKSIQEDTNHLFKVLTNSKPKKLLLEGHQCVIRHVETDGLYVVCGGSDGRVCVWDMNDGLLLYVLLGHVEEITGLAIMECEESDYHPSGDWVGDYVRHFLISSSLEGVIKLWSLKEGTEVMSFATNNGITCLKALGRDVIIAGSDNGKLIVRGASDCESIDSIKAHTDAVDKLVVQEDQELFTSIDKSGDCIAVWKLGEGGKIESTAYVMRSMIANWPQIIHSLALRKGKLYIGENSKFIKVLNMQQQTFEKLQLTGINGDGTSALFASEDLVAYTTFTATPKLYITLMPSHLPACNVRCGVKKVVGIECVQLEDEVKFVVSGSELVVLSFSLHQKDEDQDDTSSESVKCLEDVQKDTKTCSDVKFSSRNLCSLQ